MRLVTRIPLALAALSIPAYVWLNGDGGRLRLSEKGAAVNNFSAALPPGKAVPPAAPKRVSITGNAHNMPLLTYVNTAILCKAPPRLASERVP